MPWATFARSANRRFGFAVLVIVGAFAIAGCAQNAQGISPVAAKSGGAAASISRAARSGSGTASAHGRSPIGGSGDSTPSPAANGSSTACPTQSEGGDDLPALCAPPASSSARSLGVSGPASITGSPPPACYGMRAESVSPRQGAEAGGDIVAISGTGFNSMVEVFFGGTPAESLTVKSATEISATTPPGPSGGGTVEVTVGCSGADTPPIPTGSFTYEASPSAPVGPPPSSPGTVSPSSQAS
jgi:large repetitive protein